MKIKERENELLMLFKIIKGARFKHWVLLGTVALFSFIMLIIGAMSQRYGYVEIAKQSIINVRGLPLRYLKGLASRPEKLYISTKHKIVFYIFTKNKDLLVPLIVMLEGRETSADSSFAPTGILF